MFNQPEKTVTAKNICIWFIYDFFLAGDGKFFWSEYTGKHNKFCGWHWRDTFGANASITSSLIFYHEYHSFLNLVVQSTIIYAITDETDLQCCLSLLSADFVLQQVFVSICTWNGLCLLEQDGEMRQFLINADKILHRFGSNAQIVAQESRMVWYKRYF